MKKKKRKSRKSSEWVALNYSGEKKKYGTFGWTKQKKKYLLEAQNIARNHSGFKKTEFRFGKTLILVIFDLIFAMKPPKFLKNLKISLQKNF